MREWYFRKNASIAHIGTIGMADALNWPDGARQGKWQRRKRTNGMEAQDMKKIQDREQTQEVFENDIAMYLKMFCEEQGIEDMKKESQSVWNAALMYIKKHVFNAPGILKMSKPLEGYINNNYNNQYSNVNLSNCNAYDIDKVNSICNYYIYMCYLYNKSISIQGFSKLTGISDTVIYEWGTNDSRKLSTSSVVIYEKLTAERENSWTAKLESMNHPTAIAILLNKHYGYNLPGVTKEQKQIQGRTPEQIAAEYGQELCENMAQLEMPKMPG